MGIAELGATRTVVTPCAALSAAWGQGSGQGISPPAGPAWPVGLGRALVERLPPQQPTRCPPAAVVRGSTTLGRLPESVYGFWLGNPMRPGPPSSELCRGPWRLSAEQTGQGMPPAFLAALLSPRSRWAGQQGSFLGAHMEPPGSSLLACRVLPCPDAGVAPGPRPEAGFPWISQG